MNLSCAKPHQFEILAPTIVGTKLHFHSHFAQLPCVTSDISKVNSGNIFMKKTLRAIGLNLFIFISAITSASNAHAFAWQVEAVADEREFNNMRPDALQADAD